MKVAYVTTDDPVSREDDERETALAAWLGAGIEGSPVNWHDPAVDWSEFDAVVVRSAWDYIERRDEFVAWAHRVERVTRLFNPAQVLEWNTDKTYLRTLGVPIVPTFWPEPGAEPPEWELPGWEEYVVKPAVSAGARDTVRTASRDDAAAHAAGLLAEGRTAMVQPYLPSVELEGELSLLYFGGRFSHAVRRHPMLSGAPATAENRATLRDPDDDQFALAERVLAAVPPDLLYARVDLVRMPDGEPVLMEAELTEPYLFLRDELAAPDLFAEVLAETLKAG
ncbi:RimK family alpha-L-glutamate ligase [Microbispora sp. NBC_01389]|uniref:ATP-grasp domain-containing protein n=1 Tax=Microbispora sp. NBC_01389 TaxID=2903584 RepID=UPI003252D5DD